MNVPAGLPPDFGLEYTAVEVSFGSRWENINDHDRFIISSDGTRDSAQKSWRKTVATSPILGGNYLVHAVPDMINEQVGIWVYGSTYAELAENHDLALTLFEQVDFRIRWTFNDYREYWRCQLADSVSSRAQVWTHNQMANLVFTVPRYPNIEREVV